jgi:hypothetical protein
MDLTEYTRETLRGLTGVMVVVEDLKEDAQADGLSVAGLQDQTEARLAEAGIPILPLDEWRSTSGRPWLYVSVNTLRHIGGYFFSVDVQLKQEVTLPRQPSIVTSSSTWELGSIGFVMADNLAIKIGESVEAHLGGFISDFRAANSQ